MAAAVNTPPSPASIDRAMVGRRFFFVSDLDYNTPAQYSSPDVANVIENIVDLSHWSEENSRG
jgi:hypothetical protein